MAIWISHDYHYTQRSASARSIRRDIQKVTILGLGSSPSYSPINSDRSGVSLKYVVVERLHHGNMIHDVIVGHSHPKKDRRIGETPQQLMYSGHAGDVNSQGYQGLDPQPHELLNGV